MMVEKTDDFVQRRMDQLLRQDAARESAKVDPEQVARSERMWATLTQRLGALVNAR